MTATLYALKFHGMAGAGGTVLYVGNGIIAGMDAGGLIYDGTFQTDQHGAISGSARLTAKVSAQLVTGATLSQGQSVTVPFSLPANFGNGQQFQFNVGGTPVPATFEKIKDVP